MDSKHSNPLDPNYPWRFYLAAQYPRREEINGYAEILRARGYAVTAQWLTGDNQEYDSVQEMWAAFSARDVEDIVNANVLVLFSEDPRVGVKRGGRHVEYGIALGLRLACDQLLGLGLRTGVPGVVHLLHKNLVVVGPIENVFHPQADMHFGPAPSDLRTAEADLELNSEEHVTAFLDYFRRG